MEALSVEKTSISKGKWEFKKFLNHPRFFPLHFHIFFFLSSILFHAHPYKTPRFLGMGVLKILPKNHINISNHLWDIGLDTQGIWVVCHLHLWGHREAVGEATGGQSWYFIQRTLNITKQDQNTGLATAKGSKRKDFPKFVPCSDLPVEICINSTVTV